MKKLLLFVSLLTITLFSMSYKKNTQTISSNKENRKKLDELEVSDYKDLGDGCYYLNKEIFCFGIKLKGVDIKTFKNTGRYQYDKNSVYFKGEKIEKVDIKTFVVIGYRFAKDKNSVFDSGFILENVDSKSFVFISESIDLYSYAKDKNSVFFCPDHHQLCKIIDKADPKTFEIVKKESTFYSKDINHVYYCCDIECKTLDGVDPKNFDPESPDFDINNY
ncbi:DKNYY domain-containing protein [bacterium]|nr:DKNYY domain-containing protein [bacterium]